MGDKPRPEDLFDISDFHSSTVATAGRSPTIPAAWLGGVIYASRRSIWHRNSRVENPTNQQIKPANEPQGGADPAHTSVSLRPFPASQAIMDADTCIRDGT